MESLDLTYLPKYRVDRRVTDRLPEGQQSFNPTRWSKLYEGEVNHVEEILAHIDDPERIAHYESQSLLPYKLECTDPLGGTPEVRINFLRAALRIIELDIESFPDFPRVVQLGERGERIIESGISMYVAQYHLNDKKTDAPEPPVEAIGDVTRGEETQTADQDVNTSETAIQEPPSHRIYFFVHPDIEEQRTIASGVDTIIGVANDYLFHSRQPLILHTLSEFLGY